jgi:hypothetical protein
MYIKVYGDISTALWAAADITGCHMMSVSGETRVEVSKNGYPEFETTDNHNFHEWVDILTQIKLRGEGV